MTHAQAGKTPGDPAVGAALSKVVTIVPHLDVAGLERLAHASLQVIRAGLSVCQCTTFQRYHVHRVQCTDLLYVMHVCVCVCIRTYS